MVQARKSAIGNVMGTYPEEDPHCLAALLEAVHVGDGTSADGEPAGGTEGLDDAPEHERWHVVRERDTYRADAHAW